MRTRFGAVLPQNELGRSTADVVAFAREVDRLGFDHLLAYDHVLGADRTIHDSLSGPYGIDDAFREPFVLFGYLAGITELGFATAILIAPQRPTALIAKQAAELDLLSEGRLRLGCGIGWNPVEYEALGQSFAGRGERLSEQIAVLRALWTEDQVTAEVGDERIVAAGLLPLPSQRPIPIWIGAMAPAALRRVGRLADGWFPMTLPGHGLEEGWALITQAADEAGRDSSALGMEGQVPAIRGDVERSVTLIERWIDAGATHLSLSTLNQGLSGLDEHLEALAHVAEVLSLTPRS